MDKIYVHASGTLHQLITSTARGYVNHVSGVVKPDKVERVIARFEDLYETNLNRDQRAYRKKKGRCNVRLFIHPRYTTPDLQWWLLATDGEGLFYEREKPKSGLKRRSRLTAFNQYEAMIAPAKGNVPRWTWRLSQESSKNWEARIQAAIRNRKNENDLKNIMRELHSLPGFRGVRSQVAGLRKFTGYEWRRITAQDSCPHIPKKVQPYLRYKTYDQVPVELVAERLKKGKSPYALSWKRGEYKPEPKAKL